MRPSQRGVAGRRGGTSATPLLEREGELESLRRARNRLTEAAGSLVLVEGPAGIGKTRLLREAADLAQQSRAPVGFTSCVTADELPTDGRTRIGVWLELDLDAQPIEGALSPPGGLPRSFIGWLGLTAALHGLRAGLDPASGEMTE